MERKKVWTGRLRLKWACWWADKRVTSLFTELRQEPFYE